jgi:hypothetical protein
MSFYNQSISTIIIDPTFNSSKYRTEFRIVKDGLYLSNMRVHNLGLTTSTQGVIDEGAYNYLTGIHGAIENIYLYDGKQILDQVLHYADRSAFTEYNKTNQANSDIYKFASKTGLGYVLNRQPQISVQPTIQKKALVTEFYPNSAREVGDTQESTPLGFLNLREVFPMLKSVEFLHTSIFKNLRVVIEYKQGPNALAYVDGSSFTGTAQPILVIDQVMNESLAQKVLSEFKPIVWSAQEVEQVLVPASITAGQQQIKFRLNAFTNKTLSSVFIQKKSTNVNDASRLYKSYGSETAVDETIQILVDGANVLPQNGVDRPMWRLSLLSDSLGNCNAHTGSASLTPYNPQYIVDDTVRVIGGIPNTFATWADRCGRLDYFGCIINKPINTLDLVYSRTINVDADARYNQGLYLNVFGSVVKQLTPAGKNGYVVSYVF